MKPYGVPRDPNLEYPDRGDIRYFALKGYRLRGKRGRRLYWKRLERKKALRNIVIDAVE